MYYIPCFSNSLLSTAARSTSSTPHSLAHSLSLSLTIKIAQLTLTPASHKWPKQRLTDHKFLSQSSVSPRICLDLPRRCSTLTWSPLTSPHCAFHTKSRQIQLCSSRLHSWRRVKWCLSTDKSFPNPFLVDIVVF